MKPVVLSLVLVFASSVASMAEEALRLLFPVDCTLGETCFLQQFVDRDPGPKARDFACGPQSYDGHTGTDIRTADMAAMLRGVAVIASADGVVRALRDGVRDGGTATAPAGQGCGNGVVLTHPGGWETQYCHLMQGSIAVEQGQAVAAGTPLGLIGYSGRTEFPHLEFILRRDGVVIDPFDPSDAAACGLGAPPLWAQPVPHSGGGILATGFAGNVPEFAAIKAGTAAESRLPASGAALVLWAYVHGGRAGDRLRLRITDASGTEIHAQEMTLDRTQAELFRATGRRSPRGGWATGLYRGEVILIREGRVIDQDQSTALVAP